MLAFDGFSANEIDYWYPVRLCPAAAGGGVATYAQLTPLALPPSLACQAATEDARCAGRSCGPDCAEKVSSEQECWNCCAGQVLQRHAPCQLPFALAPGGARQHQCLAADAALAALAALAAADANATVADGAPHWCPTVLGANGSLEAGAARSVCADTCRQASYHRR